MTADQLRRIIREKKAELDDVNGRLAVAERAENGGNKDGYERVQLIGKITDLTKRSNILADQIRNLEEQLAQLD